MARKSRKNITPEIKFTKFLEKVYNVGIYVRLSFINKNKKALNNDTIENQKNLILDFIKNKQEFNLVEIYEDSNKTGTNFARNGFENLLDDIKKGKINCIIVKDLSRFGRNYVECGNYLEKVFPFMNVRFIAINDNYDSNNKNSKEILLIHLKNLVNEIYAKDISKKVSTAINEKQNKGEFIGNWASYGYLKDKNNKNKIVINEETAPIVKYIFDLRLKNYGYTKIAKILNEENVLSPSLYLYKKGYLKSDKFLDSKWTDNVIKSILKNEVYIGNTVQGKTKKNLSENKERIRLNSDNWIVVKGTHIPIISEDIFYKVQELNKKASKKHNLTKKANKKNGDNIFKGYLKCGKCGKALTIKTGLRKTIKNIDYFVCINKKIGACNLISIRKEILENIIFNEIKNQFIIALDLKKIITENSSKVALIQNNLKLKIKNIDNEINKIKSFYQVIYEDYSGKVLDKNDYIFTRNTYISKENILMKEKNNLENKLKQLENNLVKNNVFIENFLKFENKEILTKDLLDLLINKIIIYDDKTIQINFKYTLEYNKIISLINDGGKELI